MRLGDGGGGGGDTTLSPLRSCLKPRLGIWRSFTLSKERVASSSGFRHGWWRCERGAQVWGRRRRRRWVGGMPGRVHKET